MSKYHSPQKKLPKAKRKEIVKQFSKSVTDRLRCALKAGRQVTLNVDTPVQDVREFDGMSGIRRQCPTGEMTITLHISEERYGE